MGFMADLWLPILLNSALLFLASFVAWSVLAHHFGDRRRLSCEEEFLDAVHNLGIPPGNYMFPYAASRNERNSPSEMQRFMKGPRGILDVWDVPNMGLNLFWTYVFFLVTSAIIGYITHVSCPPDDVDTTFTKVFRVAGTIGMLCHGSSGILHGIWFKRRLITDVIDGLVYGLIIGLVFAWLWP